MVGWVLGGAALWMVSAAGVARVLGAVISRADLDDPAVGAPPVRVPAPRAPDAACGCLLDPRAVG